MTNKHFSIWDQKSLPQNSKWTLKNMDTGDLLHPTSPALSQPKISKASVEKQTSKYIGR
jgi:hypothetical protein